jgi:hypothetical protein
MAANKTKRSKSLAQPSRHRPNPHHLKAELFDDLPPVQPRLCRRPECVASPRAPAQLSAPAALRLPQPHRTAPRHRQSRPSPPSCRQRRPGSRPFCPIVRGVRKIARPPSLIVSPTSYPIFRILLRKMGVVRPTGLPRPAWFMDLRLSIRTIRICLLNFGNSGDFGNFGNLPKTSTRLHPKTGSCSAGFRPPRLRALRPARRRC